MSRGLDMAGFGSEFGVDSQMTIVLASSDCDIFAPDSGRCSASVTGYINRLAYTPARRRLSDYANELKGEP